LRPLTGRDQDCPVGSISLAKPLALGTSRAVWPSKLRGCGARRSDAWVAVVWSAAIRQPNLMFRSKHKQNASRGMASFEHVLLGDVAQDDCWRLIATSCDRGAVTAFWLQLPPGRNRCIPRCHQRHRSAKDVDGLHRTCGSPPADLPRLFAVHALGLHI